jgi:hypothetical protein
MVEASDMARSSAPNLAADGAPWRVVNDGVMGGVSSSRISSSDGRVRFEGEVRTEFNGGFASAKREVAVDAAVAAGVAAIEVRAWGDGHRYRLTFFTRDAQGQPQPFLHYAEFDTQAGRETVHTLLLTQFRASFRGRAVEAPPPAWADVIGVGLMLLKSGHRDGRGPFAIEMTAIVPA